MKLKNESKEVKHIKLKEGWQTLNPDDVIETNQLIVDDELVELQEIKLEKEKVKEPSKKKPEPFKNDFKVALKSEKELKKMTKDEINDYAVMIGLTSEIKSSMKKSEMIKKVLKLQ